MNEAFLTFLKETPEALRKFATVIRLWVDEQGKVKPTAPDNTGKPRDWKMGEKPELSFGGVTLAELNALEEAKAEGVVIDRFIAEVKAFIAGLMLKP